MNILYLLTSLFLGILIMYIYAPTPKVIIKHPTKTDTNTIYIDGNNVCYKYYIENVKCPVKEK